MRNLLLIIFMTIYIHPKEGPQEDFLKCTADGAAYAGGAGSGKTTMLQLASCYYGNDPTYTGIIFRRISKSITKAGGMWDAGKKIYHTACHCRMTKNDLTVRFPRGGTLNYSHMENEDDRFDHQGLQYAFIGFDEIAEFTKKQVFFLLTRNRPIGESKLVPFWRATSNAVSDGFFRELVDWWIDPDTGFAIPERCGVLRYYTVEDEEIRWTDNHGNAITKDWRDEDGNRAQSFTFFSAKLDDNPVRKEWRDQYRSKLRAQDKETRGRLLEANWNVAESGGFFEEEWFDIVDEYPENGKQIRYYDMATKKKEKEQKETASTAGGLITLYNGEMWILDIQDWMETPGVVEEKMAKIAATDGMDTVIGWEEEKGSAGKYVSNHLKKDIFKGYECHPDPVTGDKFARAKPWSKLAEDRKVHLLRGKWNRRFINQACAFGKNAVKKDEVDCISGAYKVGTQTKRMWPHYDSHHVKKLDIPWGKMKTDIHVIIVHLVGDGKYGIFGNCFIWSRESKILWVYDEIIHRNVVPDALAEAVKSKAKVPIMSTEKDQVKVARVYINQELNKPGDNLKKILRKHGIYSQVNRRYNDIGAAATINQMFNCDQIFVDKGCIETDRQYREWTQDSGLVDLGFPLCRALCGVVSELREKRELEPPEPVPYYSKERNAIREKMKTGKPIAMGRKDEWSYLG